MSIIKTTINNNNNNSDKCNKVLSLHIRNYLHNNPKFIGNIIQDCFNNIHVNNKNNVAQLFVNDIVFISTTSFQQNNIILGQRIRKYVLNIINNINNLTSLTCIGGESYLYGLISNVNKIIHFTNNKSIHNDAIFNLKMYKKEIINNLCDYNKTEGIIFDDSSYYCIMNLSSLNKKLIEKINNNFFKKIIIINCNEKDFWKKIKLLKNYTLIKRKKFVNYNLHYFITVNVLINKNNFISLGSNCSVAWNLKKYNLRQISFPFDWTNCKINELNDVLKNDFKDFNKLEIKKYSDLHPYFSSNDNQGTFILKNKYNITFAHEVLLEYEINTFSNKLANRINKFKNMKNPTFIRLEQVSVKREKYIELVELLKRYFDIFELILVSRENPQIKEINHINLNVNFIDWKYEHFNWNDLFNEN